MPLLKRIIPLLLCFVFTLSAKAQVENKAIALKEILQSIEKQHHVIFNYIDNEIIIFEIVPPANPLSLTEKLKYLHSKTNLSFENLDNTFINVFNTNPPKNHKVCGYVFSKETKTVLENANVKSIDNASKTITNDKGFFQLELDKSTQISISFIGYKTQTINIPSLTEDCMTIYLEQEISELEDITTHHYLTSGITKTTSGSYEMKPKKLGILPGLIEADVLQVMQQIPGINSVNESVSSINARGGTHDQNLFLWNGIKMYQTGHFFGLISVFNPNLAHTISIIKNGSSAFYGESVSSVVDISSNSNHFEKNSYSAGINMINLDGFSKFNINKKGYIEISARRSTTDIVKTPTYKDYYNIAFQNTSINSSINSKSIDFSNDETFYFFDITAKYLQKIGQKNTLILDFITINDQIRVNQSATIGTNYQSEKNVLYQQNIGVNLSYNKEWNDSNKTSLNIYTSSYELEAQKNKIEENQNVKQENEVFDSGIKLQNNHKINSKFTINNGYQFNEIGTVNLDAVNNPKFYRRIKNSLRTHALILEGKFNDSISKIHLTTGLRVNYTEQFKKYLFEPRLEFNYGFLPHFNLEILGEFKSQNCFQIIDLQKDYFGIDKRRWIIANNSTVPVQRSKQCSLGLSFGKHNWLLSLENFYKKVIGINSLGQEFQNQLEFVKINGEYEVLGSEMLVQKKINHFITWMSYSFNTNNYYFQENTPAVFPNNFELEHIVSWAGIYEKNNFKIALGSKWHSGKPITNPSTKEISNGTTLNPSIKYNSPNNSNLDSFFQVNFSTTYKWKSSTSVNYKIGFSVLNVLNKSNIVNRYYTIDAASKDIKEVNSFALGRTPNLSFRVEF